MTYSIVAYDKKTKQIGVGVETHQPAVGGRCALGAGGRGGSSHAIADQYRFWSRGARNALCRYGRRKGAGRVGGQR